MNSLTRNTFLSFSKYQASFGIKQCFAFSRTSFSTRKGLTGYYKILTSDLVCNTILSHSFFTDQFHSVKHLVSFFSDHISLPVFACSNNLVKFRPESRWKCRTCIILKSFSVIDTFSFSVLTAVSGSFLDSWREDLVDCCESFLWGFISTGLIWSNWDGCERLREVFRRSEDLKKLRLQRYWRQEKLVVLICWQEESKGKYKI